MAQISDDCFAFGGELMPSDEALAVLDERLSPVVVAETVPLRQACGRILAEEVAAECFVPPHDNAAVDGYAVYFDDLNPQAETLLPVTARIAAGHPLDRPPRRGEALRIFTGAPVPGDGNTGPDTVLMQEDCREEDGKVAIPPGISRGANLRAKGEDMKPGDVVLKQGRRLRPQDIGLAASLGCAALPVYEPLSVAVFSSGDEICDPGEKLPPGGIPEGAIYDANRYGLFALLQGLGCAVTDLGILRDDEAAVTEALAKAAPDHGLILTSGGVSTGEEDHIRGAVESLGSLHFWRLSIKPGRPLAMGQVGTTPFIGLPGNPVAVMVTFLLFARPAILKLSGATDFRPRLFRVRAGFSQNKKAGRREWVRARLVQGPQGEPVAEKFPHQGSGILSSMVEADGLVELADDVSHVAEGDMVDFLSFREVLS
ncbi:MAG: molybdopterin molybdotransferase MoeA [Alphaproteobacteria bacterium]|nr:molybdopterin molybdotransferase MoeA [Alphaproteobacteria bacterium]